jgi:hypothetical protein
VKIRLEGLEEECRHVTARLCSVLDVVSVSAPHANRGASRLVRVYVEARLDPAAPDVTCTAERAPEGTQGAATRRCAVSSKRVSEMTDAEIRALAGVLPVPRLVIAVDDAGTRVAIGPVITDRSVDELRRQVDDHGWTVAEVVPHLSRANFIAARAKGEGTVRR